MKNVLVMGIGKSGTTIISKTIAASIPGADYHLEPTRIGQVESIGQRANPQVIKILFNLWMDRRFTLEALIRGESDFKPDRIVAIIRDPRDILISRLFYLVYNAIMHGQVNRNQFDRWLNVIHTKERDPGGMSVLDMCAQYRQIINDSDLVCALVSTFERYCRWLDSHRDIIHVTRYEDFVSGNTEALEQFLGFPLVEQREVGAELQRVRRTSGKGSWRELMLPTDVANLRTAFGSMLQDHGYPDWVLHPAVSLDPATGSEYVARIAEEAFSLMGPDALQDRRHGQTL